MLIALNVVVPDKSVSLTKFAHIGKFKNSCHKCRHFENIHIFTIQKGIGIHDIANAINSSSYADSGI